ncbi:MAG: DUF2085 domain-containing protein [Candidatus Binatia bacterium]
MVRRGFTVLVRIALFVFPAFVIVSSLLAPYLESRQMGIAPFLYWILSPLCHQRPSRSLWIFGSPMGVDARCFALYTAFLLTGLSLRCDLGKTRWRIGLLLLLPILVDGFTQLFGLRESTNVLRVLTGALGGIGLGLLLYPMAWKVRGGRVYPVKAASSRLSLRHVIPAMVTISLLILSVVPLASSRAQVPDRRSVIIPEGTTVAIKALETISSETAKAGQQVQFVVVRDVTVDEVVVIKAGAPAVGEVVRAAPRKAVGREGELILALRYVKAVDGTNVRLRTSMTEKGEEKLTSTVVLSVVLCPLFLLTKGGEAAIPAGAEYKVFVDFDTEIEVTARQESSIPFLKGVNDG